MGQARSLLRAITTPLAGRRRPHRLLPTLLLLLLCRRLLLACPLLLTLGGRGRHSVEDRGLPPRLQQRAAVAGGGGGEEKLLPAHPGQQAAALLRARGGTWEGVGSGSGHSDAARDNGARPCAQTPGSALCYVHPPAVHAARERRWQASTVCVASSFAVGQILSPNKQASRRAGPSPLLHPHRALAQVAPALHQPAALAAGAAPLDDDALAAGAGPKGGACGHWTCQVHWCSQSTRASQALSPLVGHLHPTLAPKGDMPTLSRT